MEEITLMSFTLLICGIAMTYKLLNELKEDDETTEGE